MAHPSPPRPPEPSNSATPVGTHKRCWRRTEYATVTVLPASAVQEHFDRLAAHGLNPEWQVPGLRLIADCPACGAARSYVVLADSLEAA